jgi:hypothetical protein
MVETYVIETYAYVGIIETFEKKNVGTRRRRKRIIGPTLLMVEKRVIGSS